MTRAGLILVSTAIMALAAAGRGAAAPASQPAAVPDARSGRALYFRVGCAQCHGDVGQGGSMGSTLNGTALSAEAFGRQLRRPVNAMPPYTKAVLSDGDVAGIYAWIRSLRP